MPFKNPEKEKEWLRSYRQRPEVKKKKYESTKRYRALNKEKVRFWSRRSVAKSRSKGKASGLVWYYNNHEHAKRQHKIWVSKNKEHINSYSRKRISENPSLRIRNRIAGRINYALRQHGANKSSGTMDLVGCSLEVLRQWIESKWTEGMSWENHSLLGWHIDHIRPCASFDLTKESEQKKCFHYSNLQPLWWMDNISKSDKWYDGQPISEF